MKLHHYRRIEHRQFTLGDLVLLFNSWLKLFPEKKLKFKWLGCFKVAHVFNHGVIELVNKNGMRFKMNSQKVKPYFGNADEVQSVKAWALGEV